MRLQRLSPYRTCHPERYSAKDLGRKGALPPVPRSFASTLRMTRLLHIEIFRLRMMHDDGVGALFRDEHEIFADADADLLGAQQSHYVRAILEVRAGRIPEAVPASAIFLLEDFLDRRIVLAGEAQLLA